jgi:hypothetical protein
MSCPASATRVHSSARIYPEKEAPWKKSQILESCSSQAFGPIVRDAAASRKLYSQILAIPFKEEKGGSLHREVWRAQRLSPCGHSLRQLNSVTGRIRGPAMFLSRKPGLSLMLMSTRPRRSSNQEGIECWSKTENRGARLSVVSSRRKDYWRGSPSPHRCEKRNSAIGRLFRFTRSRRIPTVSANGASPRASPIRRAGLAAENW